MFDISFAELALIVAAAVIFIKPEDVPTVLRACARGFAGIKELAREVQDAFSDLAKESGLQEAHKDITRQVKMIQGDDGKMYEAYNLDDFLHPTTPIRETPSTRHPREGEDLISPMVPADSEDSRLRGDDNEKQ